LSRTSSSCRPRSRASSVSSAGRLRSGRSPSAPMTARRHQSTDGRSGPAHEARPSANSDWPPLSDFAGQTRLADATRSSQGEQPPAQELVRQLGDLPLASDKNCSAPSVAGWAAGRLPASSARAVPHYRPPDGWRTRRRELIEHSARTRSGLPTRCSPRSHRATEVAAIPRRSAIAACVSPSARRRRRSSLPDNPPSHPPPRPPARQRPECTFRRPRPVWASPQSRASGDMYQGNRNGKVVASSRVLGRTDALLVQPRWRGRCRRRSRNANGSEPELGATAGAVGRGTCGTGVGVRDTSAPTASSRPGSRSTAR